MPYTVDDAKQLAQRLKETLPPEAQVVIHDEGYGVAVRLGDKTTPAAHRAATHKHPLLDDHPPMKVPELFRSVEEVKKALGL